MTSCSREDIWRLIVGLNRALGSEATDETVLTKRFDMFWGQLDSILKTIETAGTSKKPIPRKTEDLLEEILRLLRDQQKLLRSRDGMSRLERAADALEQAQIALGYRREDVVTRLDEDQFGTRYAEDRLNPRTTLKGRASSTDE